MSVDFQSVETFFSRRNSTSFCLYRFTLLTFSITCLITTLKYIIYLTIAKYLFLVVMRREVRVTFRSDCSVPYIGSQRIYLMPLWKRLFTSPFVTCMYYYNTWYPTLKLLTHLFIRLLTSLSRACLVHVLSSIDTIHIE